MHRVLWLAAFVAGTASAQAPDYPAQPVKLVVGPSMPVKTVAEFLALVKAKPDAATYATPGLGSSPHLATEPYRRLTGTSVVHVPYKGAAPAMTELIGGHVDLHFDQLSSVLPLVEGGKLRPLSVTALLPDVPTLAEAGVARFDASTTLGLVLPGKAPPELATRLNQVLQKVLTQTAVKAQFARLGAAVMPGSPAQYAEFIRSEVARTAKIVKEAKITLG